VIETAHIYIQSQIVVVGYLDLVNDERSGLLTNHLNTSSGLKLAVPLREFNWSRNPITDLSSIYPKTDLALLVNHSG
jgi:hypothetical protein